MAIDQLIPTQSQEENKVRREENKLTHSGRYSTSGVHFENKAPPAIHNLFVEIRHFLTLLLIAKDLRYRLS
jgi:hypothetical protein